MSVYEHVVLIHVGGCASVSACGCDGVVCVRVHVPPIDRMCNFP